MTKSSVGADLQPCIFSPPKKQGTPSTYRYMTKSLTFIPAARFHLLNLNAVQTFFIGNFFDWLIINSFISLVAIRYVFSSFFLKNYTSSKQKLLRLHNFCIRLETQTVLGQSQLSTAQNQFSRNLRSTSFSCPT